MRLKSYVLPTTLLAFIAMLSAAAMLFAQAATKPASPAPLPEIHSLMLEVEKHQRELDKVRENYTYTSKQVTEDVDGSRRIKKTESEEYEVFFVNSHRIERKVKKDGKPLDDREQQKETERITKQVEKAERTPPGQSLNGQQVSVSQLLAIMEVRNPRRELYHNRPMIVFDFVGRKDAKTHGMAEDASKKLQGTMWVDEADRVVAHLDVSFNENFHVGGGLVATVDKGSNFHFEQSPIGSGLWLPTGADASVQARVALVKGIRQRFSERDSDFKTFHVDAQQVGSPHN